MKRAIIFALALVMLVGVLAACGDKTPETTTPAGTTTTTTTPAATTTTPAVTTTITTPAYSTVPYEDQDPTIGEDDVYLGGGIMGPIDENPNG